MGISDSVKHLWRLRCNRHGHSVPIILLNFWPGFGNGLHTWVTPDGKDREARDEVGLWVDCWDARVEVLRVGGLPCVEPSSLHLLDFGVERPWRD